MRYIAMLVILSVPQHGNADCEQEMRASEAASAEARAHYSDEHFKRSMELQKELEECIKRGGISAPPKPGDAAFLPLAYTLAVCSIERQIRGSREFTAKVKRAERTVRRQIAIEDQQQGQKQLAWAARQLRKAAKAKQLKLQNCGGQAVQRLVECTLNNRDQCDDAALFDSAVVQEAQSISEAAWQPTTEDQ